MKRSLLFALPWLAALLGGCDGGEAATREHAAELSPLVSDSRLNFLLAPCSRGYHYDVNTADIDGILTETLLHGFKEPLRRARSELAVRPGGLDIAMRIMRRYWTDSDGKNHIRNALDVAALSSDPRAREMLVEALGHPMEDLRVLSVRALKRHGREEDWDAVRNALDLSSPPFVVDFIQALHAIDHERTNASILDWVDGGSLEGIWKDILPLVASTTDPELVERCRAMWPKLAKGQAAPLVVAAARAGDEEARNVSRAWRDDEADTTLRRITLLALGRAEQYEELVPALQKDGSHENRLLAMGMLSVTPELTERMSAHLAAGMNDPVESVAVGCTAALARIGNAGAIDRGLEMMRDDSPGAMQSGLRVLREAMQADPAVARRAFDVAVNRYEETAHRPLDERSLFLVAMGQVPLEVSARRLLDEATRAEGAIQNFSARQWITMQAGNVGESGHELVLALLQEEDDVAHRIDLIEALSMRGGEQAREVLLDYVNGERATPYEILYAADRLVRIGPAGAVAPVLKRVTLRVEQPDVRRALQCLLWASYPGPR